VLITISTAGRQYGRSKQGGNEEWRRSGYLISTIRDLQGAEFNGAGERICPPDCLNKNPACTLNHNSQLKKQ